jgi:small nuclear ribonucleoprotein (snRNP)-like protein
LYRKGIVKRAVLRRFAVTLRGIEDTFSGVLTEFDADMYVFEDCKTVITRDGETSTGIPGRLFVDRKTVAYLQELP